MREMSPHESGHDTALQAQSPNNVIKQPAQSQHGGRVISPELTLANTGPVRDR
jgi:hypothetical protein